MIRAGKSLIWMPLIFALTAGARGSISESNANPYQVIVERNAFGLKPPAPPPAATNKPPETHNIKFTGITRDSSGKKAFMISTEPAKPGKQPNVEYYSLGEGQRQGDIEVKEINETAETVTILNGAELVTLNFKEHGNTPTLPPAQPMAPGVPPPPGMLGAPPGMPVAAPAAAAYNNRYGMPAMNSMNRNPGNVGGGVTQPNAANDALRSIPTRPLRGQMAPEPPPVDPAAQAALMTINEQLNAGKGFPPLPPLIPSGP